MITQLVYTSRPSFDLASAAGQTEIAAILASAYRNNPLHQVTGFLMLGPNWFAQILEGQNSDITTIFKRILADERHHAIRLLDTRLCNARMFSDWAMGATKRPLEQYPVAGIEQFVTALTDDLFSSSHVDRIITMAQAITQYDTARQDSMLP